MRYWVTIITNGLAKPFASQRDGFIVMCSNHVLLERSTRFMRNKIYSVHEHIPICACLKCFNAIICQITCFVSSSTTLTRHECYKLDDAFRNIARRIVGHPSSWNSTRPYYELLHATHERLSHVCKQRHISSWNVIARTRQWQLIGYIMRGEQCK